MRLNRSYFLFEIFIIAHILTIIGKDVYYAWYHPELLEEYARADQSIFGSLFTLLFLYMIKYKQEGYRYNAILLLVLEIYICTTKLLALSGPLYQLTTIGLLLVYVADIVLHPIHKLQHEQDRYQVGLKQMQLNDSSKTELSIWYPCKKGRQGEGKWITQPNYMEQLWLSYKEENKLLKRATLLPRLLFKAFLSFFDFVQIYVQHSGQLAPMDSPYKIGIFSHGIPGHRNLHSYFISDMVSNGSIIISIDHKDQVKLSCQQGVFNESDPGYQQQEMVQRQKQQELRLEQINNLIESLHTKNSLKAVFDREISLDLDNLFVIGHLDGGGSALAALLTNERVKSCIAIDPVLKWIPAEKIMKPTNKSLLLLQSEAVAKNAQKCQVYQDAYQLSKQFYLTQKAVLGNKFMCYLKNSTPHHFTDLAIMMPYELQLTGRIKNYSQISEIFITYSKLINIYLYKFAFRLGNQQEDLKKSVVIDSLNMQLRQQDIPTKTVIRLNE